MKRGTTPEYVLTIPGHDLSAQTVEVAIAQRGVLITKTGDELSIDGDEDGSTVAFRLTQEETLALTPGLASVQVRFVDAQGHANATDTGQIKVDAILRNGVLDYEGAGT